MPLTKGGWGCKILPRCVSNTREGNHTGWNAKAKAERKIANPLTGKVS